MEAIEPLFTNARSYTQEEQEIYRDFIDKFFDHITLDPKYDKFVSEHFWELI